MRFGIGTGYVTTYLSRVLRSIAHKGKHWHRCVAMLFLQLTVIDSPAVNTRWRTGF